MNFTISKKQLKSILTDLCKLRNTDYYNDCIFFFYNGYFKIADYEHNIEIPLTITNIQIDKKFAIVIKDLRRFLNSDDENNISIKLADDRLIFSTKEELTIESTETVFTSFEHFKPHHRYNKNNDSTNFYSLPLKRLTKNLVKIALTKCFSYLDQIQFDIKENYTIATASDAHRVISKKIKNSSPQKPCSFAVDHQIINIFNKITKDEFIDFYIGDDQYTITIINGNYSAEFSIIDDTYPKFIEYIEQVEKDLKQVEKELKPIKIEKDIFTKHLTNLKPQNDKHPIVKLSFNDDQFTMNHFVSHNQTIEKCETMTILDNKEKLEFYFNYKYLTDMLKTIKNKNIEMQFNPNNYLCSINDFSDNTYFIMGMKIKQNKALVS